MTPYSQIKSEDSVHFPKEKPLAYLYELFHEIS